MKHRLTFAGKKFIRMGALLLGVSLVTFLLMSASPLDPLQTNVGETALGSMSREQVEKSRRQYGENRLSRRAGDTLLYRLRRAFINPFTVVLFVLALISFVTDVLLASNFSRDFTTPLIILGMLLLSAMV